MIGMLAAMSTFWNAWLCEYVATFPQLTLESEKFRCVFLCHNTHTHYSLQHPFIVDLLYAFQTDGKLYLILEYLSGKGYVGLVPVKDEGTSRLDLVLLYVTSWLVVWLVVFVWASLHTILHYRWWVVCLAREGRRFPGRFGKVGN